MKSISFALVGLTFLLCTCSIGRADLLINEIMADPASGGGFGFDSNNDGTFGSADDEYLEIVNNMATTFDISGFTITDLGSTRHTFAASTVLSAGQAIVVFGGGTPMGTFGGSLATVASSGALSLNNGGDTVSVLDLSEDVVSTYIYGSEGDDSTSLTRDPDLTGGFVKHDETVGGLVGSPGVRINGTNFTAVPEPSAFAFLALTAGIVITARRVFLGKCTRDD